MSGAAHTQECQEPTVQHTLDSEAWLAGFRTWWHQLPHHLEDGSLEDYRVWLIRLSPLLRLPPRRHPVDASRVAHTQPNESATMQVLGKSMHE